jgi:hypothetical protein
MGEEGLALPQQPLPEERPQQQQQLQQQQAKPGARNVLLWLRARELPAARRHAAPPARPGQPARQPDAGANLGAWAECNFLRRCAATYCELSPPPRSTIAAAFSPDGALLASTQCALSPLWQSILLGKPLQCALQGPMQSIAPCALVGCIVCMSVNSNTWVSWEECRVMVWHASATPGDV